MRCDIKGCQKECIRGQFVITKIAIRDRITGGPKPIDFFMVACEDCIQKNPTLQVVGSIEVKNDETLSMSNM